MSLSYGMDAVAQEIFSDFLEDTATAQEQNRAWFFLGKMAWQRGEVARAAAAFENLSGDIEAAISEEAKYLGAAVAMSQGNSQLAQRALEQLGDDSKWRNYLYYNLGANEAAATNWALATEYFDHFSETDAGSPEALALRDKGLTAAGYVHLAAQDYAAASEVFQQVRLQSPESDRALLGYGWAEAELDNYQTSLSPWLALSDRSLLQESARESLLAVPYAYEKLDRPGFALAQYRRAAKLYETELQAVQEAILAFREKPLAPMLGIEQEGFGDWLFEEGLAPVGQHSAYLEFLASRHYFQVALRELRDLYRIAAQLERATGRLQVLEDVDGHQQQVWQSLVEQNRREQMWQRQQQLAQQVPQLRSQLDLARQTRNSRALASAQQLTNWSRLERAQQLAQNLELGAEEREKIRLLRGLMLWRDNESFPEQIWRAEKSLRELEALTQNTPLLLARVDTAIAQRIESDFQPRISALQQRKYEQTALVDTAIQHSESGVRQLAILELERQSQQLSRALGQSSLAIARLYDQESVEHLP